MAGSSCYSVCSPGRLFAFRIFYASIGIFVGLTVAAIFPVRFDNIHAGGWGFTSALLATLTLVQFIYLFVVKERRRNVPNPWVLFVFGVIGSMGIGAGVGGFAAYLGLGILDTINNREPSLPASHYVVCVWCFMNFKWGLTLFLYALMSFKYLDKVVGFKRMINEDFNDHDDLEQEEEEEEEGEGEGEGEEIRTDLDQEALTNGHQVENT